MTSNSLSDEDVGRLAEAISFALAQILFEQSPNTELQNKVASQNNQARRRRGPHRSPYNGQLSLKVRREDQQWFRDLADDLDVMNGRMFEILRNEVDEEKVRRVFQLPKV